MITTTLLLPAVLTAILIFILLFISSSLVYSTIKLGISPMPSSNKAYFAMMTLTDETGTGPIVDLGSGWGSLVIRIAKKYPQRQIIGYELSWLPWLISVCFKKLLGLKNLTLHRQNFYHADLANASVLVCYLFPGAMAKISTKLQQEQTNTNFIISNNFALPGCKPYKKIVIDDFYKSPIYLYTVINSNIIVNGTSHKKAQ